ncbi:hypothetical protein Hypma_008580 [Hypsizygus marmoreus]|uniref:Uncharacterized protein n=1 Tax=Hypsizygus marmoreus TaxID=39966 RepID=A0A369JZD4_HYPMA|nr:hypothetical protein Hypma_008580 [Hypsizygus marmoreus]
MPANPTPQIKAMWFILLAFATGFFWSRGADRHLVSQYPERVEQGLSFDPCPDDDTDDESVEALMRASQSPHRDISGLGPKGSTRENPLSVSDGSDGEVSGHPSPTPTSPGDAYGGSPSQGYSSSISVASVAPFSLANEDSQFYSHIVELDVEGPASPTPEMMLHPTSTSQSISSDHDATSQQSRAPFDTGSQSVESTSSTSLLGDILPPGATSPVGGLPTIPIVPDEDGRGEGPGASFSAPVVGRDWASAGDGNDSDDDLYFAVHPSVMVEDPQANTSGQHEDVIPHAFMNNTTAVNSTSVPDNNAAGPSHSFSSSRHVNPFSPIPHRYTPLINYNSANQNTVNPDQDNNTLVPGYPGNGEHTNGTVLLSPLVGPRHAPAHHLVNPNGTGVAPSQNPAGLGLNFEVNNDNFEVFGLNAPISTYPHASFNHPASLGINPATPQPHNEPVPGSVDWSPVSLTFDDMYAHPENVFRQPMPFPRTYEDPGITAIERTHLDDRSLIVCIRIRGPIYNIYYLEDQIEQWVIYCNTTGKLLDLKLELCLTSTAYQMYCCLRIMEKILRLFSSVIGTLHLIVPDTKALFGTDFRHPPLTGDRPSFDKLTSFTWDGNIQDDLPNLAITLSDLPFGQLTTLCLNGRLAAKDWIEILYRCNSIVNLTVHSLESVEPQLPTKSAYYQRKRMTYLKTLQVTTFVDVGPFFRSVVFSNVTNVVLRAPCHDWVLALSEMITWTQVSSATLIAPNVEELVETIGSRGPPQLRLGGNMTREDSCIFTIISKC